MPLTKVVPEGGGGAGGTPVDVTCLFARTYPVLCEFISVSTWPDGAARVPGTITLMADPPMWKAAVNDRDTDSSAFVSGKTLTALFTALEKGLATGSLSFRVWRPDRKKKRS